MCTSPHTSTCVCFACTNSRYQKVQTKGAALNSSAKCELQSLTFQQHGPDNPARSLVMRSDVFWGSYCLIDINSITRRACKAFVDFSPTLRLAMVALRKIWDPADYLFFDLAGLASGNAPKDFPERSASIPTRFARKNARGMVTECAANAGSIPRPAPRGPECVVTLQDPRFCAVRTLES